MITSSKYIIYCLAFLILSVSLKAQTPNIVIIVCDDLNDSIEGIGGHPQAYTPNINRIAASGVTFINAASNAPICGPSRASLWSGIHPTTSGMYGASQQNNRWYNNEVLKSKKTLFEHFIDQGYYSYATGKIHHNGHESPYGGNPVNAVSGTIHNNIMRNLDGSVGYENQGNYGSYNNKPGNFGPYPNYPNNDIIIVEPYQDLNGNNKRDNNESFTDYNENGEYDPAYPTFQGVDPQWWPQAYRNRSGPPYSGFGAYRDLSSYGGQWTYQSGGQNNASFTTWNLGEQVPDEICAAQAVRFINTYNESSPFLLTVGFVRPHSPYYAPEEFFEAPYVPTVADVQLAPINDNDYNDINGPVNVSDQDLAQTSGWYKYTTYKNMGNDVGDPEIALKEFTQAYLACVAFVDAQVGKILDAIEARGDGDNTVIIFTSDHGYHLGEKQYIFKQSPWEESCRIPFVVSGPGVASNKVCTQPISLVDIYPTCIDYANIVAPHDLDGNSIKPLLEDPENGNGWTGAQYSVSGIGSSASVTQNAIAPYSEQHFSIRTEQYRYIYYRNGQEELYDHNTDPNEWENLASSPEHLSALETMRTYYRYAVGLEEPPPPGPTFYFVKPIDGEGFYLHEPILLEAGGTNLDLSSVEFYIEGTSIKNDGVAPYTATLYDVSEGDIVLSAIGKQSSGDDLSTQINISVGNLGFDESLIGNSGFESGNSDSGLIPFGSINLAISSNQAFGGSNSLFVERSAASSPAAYHGVRFYLSGSNATDTLEVGATYQFSSKVYLTASSVNLALTIKELSDPIVYNTVANFADGVEAGTWVDLSGQFVYQDIMEFIYIAGVDAGVDFYVDDISLSKIIPSVNPEDTDSDGMLDSWEQTYFGNLDSLPNEDPDGDGLNNLIEYRSDTVPISPALLFGVTGYTHGESDFELIWRGSPSKDYRVLSTADLSEGQWSVVEEAIPGNLTYENIWTNGHQEVDSKFFKVEIDE